MFAETIRIEMRSIHDPAVQATILTGGQMTKVLDPMIIIVICAILILASLICIGYVLSNCYKIQKEEQERIKKD